MKIPEKADENTNKSNFTTKQLITTSLIAGALAGAIAKTCIAPLDLAKINFQVGNSVFTYNKLLQFLYNGVHKHGVLSLWRGNSANMIRVVPAAAINFTSHEQYKRLLKVDSNQSSTPFKRFLAGSLAGMTSAICTYPADLARARMAVTSKLEYKTLIHIFSRTYRTEGLRGLYRGFSISILGTIPYAGVGYFTYETLKRFHKKRKSDNPNPVYRLVYGALAGVAGQTTTYPLDILRRRIQTANFINPNESHLNAIQLFEKILHQEGFIKGLYKGLSMNWIKGPIAAGIGFMCYDVLQIAVRKSYCTLFLYQK